MSSVKIKIVPREFSNFISALSSVNKTIWLECRRESLQARLYDENQQNVKSLSLSIINSDFEKTFKVGFVDAGKINKIISNFITEKEIDMKLTYGLSGFASDILFSSGNLKIKYPLADPLAYVERFVDDQRFDQILNQIKEDFSFNLTTEQLAIVKKNIDLSNKNFVQFKSTKDGVFVQDGDSYLNLKLDDTNYSKEYISQFMKTSLDCLDSGENYTVECSEHRTIFKSQNTDAIILVTNIINFEEDWDSL